MLEAVRIYKELSEVEPAFASLNDVIELRPIYHQTDQRVQAHIFVAALAFLLQRAIEKKLKAAGVDLSATEALQALRTVRERWSLIWAPVVPAAVSPAARTEPPALSPLPASASSTRQHPQRRPKRSRSDNRRFRPTQFQGLARQKGKHGLA